MDALASNRPESPGLPRIDAPHRGVWRGFASRRETRKLARSSSQHVDGGHDEEPSSGPDSPNRLDRPGCERDEGRNRGPVTYSEIPPSINGTGGGEMASGAGPSSRLPGPRPLIGR